MPTHVCRATLSGRFAHIQNWGDRFAGIAIFATIIANIGGPDEAPRNFPLWSTLLLKIYCRMADVNQEIRVQLPIPIALLLDPSHSHKGMCPFHSIML